MFTIKLLQEMTDAGGPLAWLETYFPEPSDIPEPCFAGCDCGCESLHFEHQVALSLASAIRAETDPETLSAIEARVNARREHVMTDLAEYTTRAAFAA